MFDYRELDKLKVENQKLREELRLKTKIWEKYETDLYKLRYENFSDLDSFAGVRCGDEELVAILRRGKTIDGNAILKELQIDSRDSEAVKLVSHQLEDLRRYGLVKETSNGWRWIT